MRDSVVLITGTRKGIGRYLAEHYVRQGAQVVGCSRGEPEWSLENYTHFCLDVTDEAAVRKMVAAVNKQFGRIDVLINNAGIASMNHVLLTP
ncbi:MAG: SDR family NAD(P)-dependent oxidoreductase, partial [Caldilinea sp.]